MLGFYPRRASNENLNHYKTGDENIALHRGSTGNVFPSRENNESVYNRSNENLICRSNENINKPQFESKENIYKGRELSQINEQSDQIEEVDRPQLPGYDESLKLTTESGYNDANSYSEEEETSEDVAASESPRVADRRKMFER